MAQREVPSDFAVPDPWPSPLHGRQARGAQKARRREVRLRRRRELLDEHLLMTRLLRNRVDALSELSPAWSDFLSGQLRNMRLRVELEPSGHPPTDALQGRVLREIAALLRDVQARTTPDA